MIQLLRKLFMQFAFCSLRSNARSVFQSFLMHCNARNELCKKKVNCSHRFLRDPASCNWHTISNVVTPNTAAITRKQKNAQSRELAFKMHFKLCTLAIQRSYNYRVPIINDELCNYHIAIYLDLNHRLLRTLIYSLFFHDLYWKCIESWSDGSEK